MVWEKNKETCTFKDLYSKNIIFGPITDSFYFPSHRFPGICFCDINIANKALKIRRIHYYTTNCAIWVNMVAVDKA